MNFIKRWYEGNTEIVTIDATAEQPIPYTGPVTHYHCTARWSRIIIGFFLDHWQWCLTTIVASLAAYAAFIKK